MPLHFKGLKRAMPDFFHLPASNPPLTASRILSPEQLQLQPTSKEISSQIIIRGN